MHSHFNFLVILFPFLVSSSPFSLPLLLFLGFWVSSAFSHLRPLLFLTAFSTSSFCSLSLALSSRPHLRLRVLLYFPRLTLFFFVIFFLLSSSHVFLRLLRLLILSPGKQLLWIRLFFSILIDRTRDTSSLQIPFKSTFQRLGNFPPPPLQT